jgi:hypothetical protein
MKAILEPKKFYILLILLYLCFPGFSQWNFLNLTGDTCFPHLQNSYTYQNGSSHTERWFQIFRNWTMVHIESTGYWGVCMIEGMQFVNESTGFIFALGSLLGMYTFQKTDDYADDWSVFCPANYPNNFEWYFLNADAGYLLSMDYLSNGFVIHRLTQSHNDIIYENDSLVFPGSEVNIVDSIGNAASCKPVNYIGFKISVNGNVINLKIWPKQKPLGIGEEGQNRAITVIPNPASSYLTTKLNHGIIPLLYPYIPLLG